MECLPALGTGGFSQPRVLRKKAFVGLDAIIHQEILDGESEKLEMKSSLTFDRDKHLHKPDLQPKEYFSEGVLFAALKTIAAFLNTSGGTLLIGVKDDGSIIGVEADYAFARRPEQEFDGWELYLRGAIEKYFVDGQVVNSYLSVQRFKFSTGCVARIQIAPRNRLSFLKNGQRVELYIRSGNRSMPVPFEKIEDYFEIKKRYL